MLKKISFITLSLFLIWQSYKLVGHLGQVSINSFLLTIFLAWIINMFITGIFAFPGFVLPTQNLLPEAYYQIHSPNVLKAWFDRLGVKTFRKILLATLWRNQEQRKGYFNGRKKGMDQLWTKSKKSEFGHLLPFIILNGVAIFFLFREHYLLAIATASINFLGNFYPILLQRHHRMRLTKLRKLSG